MRAAEPTKVHTYRDLRVWQKAMDLVVLSYELTKKLPAEERYGLISQIKRSASSVPANIAEGHGRKRTGDYLHHLSIAHGSLMELETHLLIAQRLAYLQLAAVTPLLQQSNELSRMLSGLVQKLREKIS